VGPSTPPTNHADVEGGRGRLGKGLASRPSRWISDGYAERFERACPLSADDVSTEGKAGVE
jgi:hypothetical protein